MRIAATTTTAQTILPGLLRWFLNIHPGIEVAVEDCSPDEFAERLASDRVDCGIGTLSKPVMELQEHPFAHDRLAAAGLKEHLARGRSITWKQLQALPLIVAKQGYGVRRSIDQAALSAGVELHIEHEVSLLNTALAMAAGGLGVAIAPYSHARCLVVRTLMRPHVERATSLIHLSSRALSPAAQSLLALLSTPGSGNAGARAAAPMA